MAKASNASVLIIDDQQEGSELALYLQGKRVGAKVLHPEEVEIDDLDEADLVLVDYQLERWRYDGGTPISRQPRDGLALASVLRRHVHDREKKSPTAFAILTGKIDQLAAPLPPENREHILARISNLEWVFRKAQPGSQSFVGDQIAALASAIRKLPKQWQKAEPGTEMVQLANEVLGIEKAKCNGQILETIAACIPPIHELSQWSHGLAIIRWLLHRILPYPCFLWDSYYLAARLRVDHSWLLEQLKGNKRMQKFLLPCRYTGLLADFAGPRWWRSSTELLLWQTTKGESFNKSSIWGVLAKLTRTTVQRSAPADHPLVCVNSDYKPLEKFASLDAAVRIRPDDWPSYADEPWTTVELAESEKRLLALVVAEDREKLNRA